MRRREGVVRDLAIPLAGLCALVVYGIVGYMVVGYSAVDAVQHTILVLTTVGFTPHLHPSAAERLLTASLAGLGVAAFLATLAVFAAALSEGRVGIVSRRRRMQRRIANLNDHFILCAYGRVGRAVAREFEAQGIPFVVLDRLEDLEDRMRYDGVPYMIGDPSSERLLREVGIERARGLISAVDSDADNVYIVMTARSLRTELFIVARASESAAADRLYRAGADRVISPYVSSGRHMAMLALRPRVVDYLDMTGLGQQALRLEELRVEAASPLIGRTLAAVCGRATPLVVRRGAEVIPRPPDDLVLEAEDLIVLLGEPRALEGVEGDR